MAIDLNTFNSGDTDYIAKLNANVSTLENAINGLQMQAGALPAAATSGLLMDVLFNHDDALIGSGSYKPTSSGTTLKVAPGGMYIAESQRVVSSSTTTNLNFVGLPPGTYYVLVDGAGNAFRHDDAADPGVIYSVSWNGSNFSAITKLVPVFFDTIEAEASRSSVRLGTFVSLDGRLESAETAAKDAVDTADDALDVAQDALDKANELEGAIFAAAVYTIRKVGITVDNVPGPKGSIQLDFGGEILGWSVIADRVGALNVEVHRRGSAPPPAAPSIPNPSTDKISGNAPITLAAAQSAARNEAGVSTWTTTIQQWDTLMFYTNSVSTLTRATLYLRIREIPPLQNIMMPQIPTGENLTAPLFVLNV